MRFIAVQHLCVGHKLASNFVAEGNRILLKKGVRLTARHIRQLQRLGCGGLYIDDALSQDIDTPPTVSLKLRQAVIKEMRDVFALAGTRQIQTSSRQIKALRALALELVDQILESRGVVVNIADLKTYDDYTFSHSLNVSMLSTVTGAAMGLPRASLMALATGALLHDIGKVFIPKEIIAKPQRLTPEEYRLVQNHSRLGYEYLKEIEDVCADACVAALTHHELYSGGGYPDGLSGESIPLIGRIVCVADVYDAMTSDRPYRKGLCPADAMEYIMGGYNRLFDPAVVDAFLRKVAPFPVGTCVELSNRETGIVVQNYEGYGLRPRVRIVRDDAATAREIDLLHDRSAISLIIRQAVSI